jgi:phosphate-selective porin
MGSGGSRLLLFLAACPTPVLAQSSDGPSVKLSGYIQAREVYQHELGLAGSINRARLVAAGNVIEKVSWRIQGEFRTGSVGNGRSSVSLQDAYLRYAPAGWAVQVGQFKTPFTREYMTSLADLETADRSSVVDSLSPKRDIGVMGEYSYQRLSVWAGAFNGEGINVTSNADSTLLGVARVAVSPLSAFSVAANVARYFGDSTRYGVDGAYENKRLTLRAEYVAERDDVTSQNRNGWYGLGAVLVTPAVQAVARYEDYKVPSTPSSRNRAWTAGLNVYPSGRKLRLTFDYLSRRIGEPAESHGRVLAQVQAKF